MGKEDAVVMAMSDGSAAAPALAEADTVIARLLPLTRPAGAATHDLQEHLASAWFQRIEALRALGRHADAVAAADALARHFEPTGSPAVAAVEPPAAGATQLADPTAWPWLARALCEKARALVALGTPEPALAAVREVQQRFAGAQALPLREWVACAGLEEVQLRAGLGATFARVDMVRHCQALADHFGGDDRAETRVLVGRIRLRRGRLLAQLDYDDEALKDYAALHADLHTAAEPRLRELAADALHAQARLLRDLGRMDEALARVEALEREYADDAYPGIRHTLALAQADRVFWWFGGQLKGGAGVDPGERMLQACDAVVASHADSPDVPVLVCVNQALRLKAQALREQADAQEEKDEDGEVTDALRARADAVTDRQWAQYGGHADARVQYEVLDAMLGKLAAWDRPEDELAGYQALLDRYGTVQEAALQPLLARTLQLKAWAQRTLDRPGDALETLEALDARYRGDADPAIHGMVAAGGLERARLLFRTDHADEALGVIATVTQAAMPGADADGAPAELEGPESLRQVVARALDLQADIWKERTPPEHPRQEGKDETGAPIVVVPTEAEQQFAAAVDTLARRFGADPSTSLRTIAAHASYDLAVHQREHLHLQAAIASYDRHLALFEDDTTPAIEKLTASALLNKAYILMMLVDRAPDALAVYDTLIARFSSATSAAMRDTLARAAASRLTCLNRMQRQGLAVNYGDQYEGLSLERRDAITATIERARLLGEGGRHRDAIALYDEVLEAHVESLHPELRRQCLDAMVRKGYSLGRLAQREAALAVNDEIIARYGSELSTTFEKDVALAMTNRAVQLDRLGRHDEELATYAQIIDRWKTSNVPELRQRVASARFNRALTLSDTDLDTALALYQEVIDTGLHAPEIRLRLEAAKSTVNRGFRLRGVGRHAEAVACYEALLQACGTETDTDVAAQVLKARIGLARSYGKAAQPERAIETYRALLALPTGELDSEQRNSLQAEYRQLQPADTPLGKVAHAFGAWIGKRKR